MKIMFSAGEASGDTHAASVANALKELVPDVEMLGMGGLKMQEAGVRIVYDIENLGYIGIVEIIKALPNFFKLRSFLKKVMMEERPDVLVCVDYPGFNMRLAKVAHNLGIPVLYYIAPTIWAWHNSRGKDIAKYTDKVASIFPFEKEAYEAHHANVTFVGHPLLDIVKSKLTDDEMTKKYDLHEEETRILLMPGSRKQEVLGLLDIMLEAMEEVSKTHGKVRYFLPRAHTISREVLMEKIEKHPNLMVTITEEDTYDLMRVSDIAIAASGTATLETALMNLPTILVYKVAPLTYAIGKRVVRIPYVGLPNIVANEKVIPELLQEDVNPKNISHAVNELLEDEVQYQKMKERLRQVKAELGSPGAVRRVAELIVDLASSEA